jgi:hypothetical protein
VAVEPNSASTISCGLSVAFAAGKADLVELALVSQVVMPLPVMVAISTVAQVPPVMARRNPIGNPPAVHCL